MLDWYGVAPGRHDETEPPAFWTSAEWQAWQHLFAAVPNPEPAPRIADPVPAGPSVALPPSGADEQVTVSQALARRRSRRRLHGPVPLDRLSHPLRGLFRPEPGGAVPSSANCGGLHELTPYLCAVDVAGLPSGLYECQGETLIRAFAPEDWPERVARRVGRYLGQRDRPVPAAVLWRVRWPVVLHRYHPGGLLTAFWDAGAALQTAYLLTEEAGLAGCACAALPSADDLTDLGWLPAQHAFVAAFAIGLDLS
ncbi:MAG: hypothetical protein AUI14_06205 [Actinobacteria bacterium 13_2_20CM_2_71_6]|nr:MAG: hypothetical protein AUI14_06205 [Actinobacteria bacterium 13_2_20CM_2_71_6]